MKREARCEVLFPHSIARWPPARRDRPRQHLRVARIARGRDSGGGGRGVAVRCVWLSTSVADAQVNAVTRIVERYGKLLDVDELASHRKRDPAALPPMTQFRYQRELEAPDVSEGFARVDVVPFGRRADPSRAERAVLIWCDGILVRSRSNQRAPSSADDLVVDVGRAATLRRYAKEGFRLLGLSWQPDIAEGKRTAADVDAVFAKMNELLGLAIEVEYCRTPPVLPGAGAASLYRDLACCRSIVTISTRRVASTSAMGPRTPATRSGWVFHTVLHESSSMTKVSNPVSAPVCRSRFAVPARPADGRSVAVQVPVEPVDLPVDALDEVLRLAGAREVVVLAREEHDLARHAEVLQRAEPLLALLDRHAEVVVGVQDQRRRLDVLHVLQRRRVPVEIVLLEDVAAEVVRVAVGAVARAVVADEVRDAAQRDRRLEARGVADDPVRHVAAVAAAGHAEAVRVDPRDSSRAPRRRRS